jgi:hypothetical protein
MKKIFNIAAFFSAGTLITIGMVMWSAKTKAVIGVVPFNPTFLAWCTSSHGTMMNNAAGSAGCALTTGFVIPQE